MQNLPGDASNPRVSTHVRVGSFIILQKSCSRDDGCSVKRSKRVWWSREEGGRREGGGDRRKEEEGVKQRQQQARGEVLSMR